MFKNLQVNLTANGTAAVLIVLMICVTTLGLRGDGPTLAAFCSLSLILGFVLFKFIHPTEEHRDNKRDDDDRHGHDNP